MKRIKAEGYWQLTFSCQCQECCSLQPSPQSPAWRLKLEQSIP